MDATSERRERLERTDLRVTAVTEVELIEGDADAVSVTTGAEGASAT